MSWQVYRQVPFNGGENRRDLPTMLAPNQLARAENCIMSSEGVLETRPGITLVNTTAVSGGRVTSLHVYPRPDGVNFLIAQSGTTLYAAPWTGSQIVSMTAIKTGLDVAPLRSVIWKNLIFFGNGVDDLFTFDGTNCADVAGSPPKTAILKLYAGRLFCVDYENPNQLRYSDLESYTSWPALNVILVRDNDGDFITGLSPQIGGLVISKTMGMYTLYGTSKDSFRLSESFSHVGAVNPDCLLDSGVFMGVDNWYRFSLSQVAPVANTHTVVLDNATLEQKRAAYGVTQAKYARHLFRIRDSIIVIDDRHQCITTWKGLPTIPMIAADLEGYNGDLLLGGAGVGHVYTLSGTTDNGVPIQTIIQTGQIDHGTAEEKEWRYFLPDIEISSSTDTVEFTYGHNVNNWASYGTMNKIINDRDYLYFDIGHWDEQVWGDESLYSKSADPFYLHNVKGRYIAHRIIANQQIKFKGYSTKFRVAGRW